MPCVLIGETLHGNAIDFTGLSQMGETSACLKTIPRIKLYGCAGSNEGASLMTYERSEINVSGICWVWTTMRRGC